ncbi:FAD-dependent monooxygenase [Pedobacter sp. L105]|uniref:FAD-dependent monooxygenase n=1 Tax=Pedobacter sp. L105 TaxID=1641871 RepID=UPI00131B43F9|nr:FAD-dependent monooxygenase [Pedobacter sp. L105]
MNNQQKQEKTTLPVLIAGAGPTGLTAAMELSRMGIPVRIIDKAQGPSKTSRALAVQSRTIELMGQRGLAKDMLAKGNPVHHTTIYNEKRILGKVNLALIQSRYNFCLLISQAETEGLLRDQVARQGIVIEWATEMTDFTQLAEDNGITAAIKKPDGKTEQFGASYLISAEGAHSIARTKLGLHFEGKTMGQNYALGDLHIDGEIPEDEMSVFISKKGFVALFPMTGKRFRMMVTDPENHTKADAPPTIEELQNLYNNVVHLPGRLFDMNWGSRYGINSRMMKTLKVGNVFFGGDSAHIHSPAGGQGMNTGIQDMINLSWKMAFVIKGLAKSELLESYEEERVPIIKGLLNTTEKATDMFNSLNPVIYSLMSAFIPPLLSFKFIQKKGTSIISEVANEYKESRLSAKGRSMGSLNAGMRVPDTLLQVKVVLKDGHTSFVYDLLNPSAFTILLVNQDADQVPGTLLKTKQQIPVQIIASVTGKETDYENVFGRHPGFILVRPDSYVAACDTMENLSVLEDWLGQWLV